MAKFVKRGETVPPVPHAHAEYAGCDHSHPYAPTIHHHDALYASLSHNHDSAYASAGHTHNYAPLSHPHAQSDVTGLITALGQKVDNTDARLTDARTPLPHNHDSVYAPVSHTHPYAPLSHTHAIGDVTNLVNSLTAKQDASQRGQANGYASLDSQGKVPTAQLTSSTIGTMKKTADQNFTSTSYADVTDLSFPVLANTDYAFEFTVIWSSVATTTGVSFALNGPASPVLFHATVETATSATVLAVRQDTAYDQGTASASIDAANANRLCRIKGVLRNGANAGNLVVRCKTEVANSAITVKRGSWGTYF